ncbi:hypothetical protein, partial [Lentilactobacillus hilgardii]
MKRFIKTIFTSFGLLYSAQGICHDGDLLKYYIQNKNVNDSIKYIGKNLPIPLEMASNIFGTSTPFVRSNDNFILYNGKTDNGLVSKINSKFITKDGYHINSIEEKMINPPYISEILIGFDSSEKCLNPKLLSDILNEDLYLSKTDFIYSKT